MYTQGCPLDVLYLFIWHGHEHGIGVGIVGWIEGGGEPQGPVPVYSRSADNAASIAERSIRYPIRERNNTSFEAGLRRVHVGLAD